MKNELIITINNCAQCSNHCIERIYTADSFEHEMGLYCKATPQSNKPGRLVASDDRDVTKYSDIPDWCPMLPCNKNKSNTLSKDVKILVIVGMPKTYKTMLWRSIKEKCNIEIVTDADIFGHRPYHLNGLKSSIDYFSRWHSSGNFVIVIEEPSTKLDEINAICNEYGSNCQSLFTFDDANDITISLLADLEKAATEFFMS